MRVIILPLAIILTKAHRAVVSIMAKGRRSTVGMVAKGSIVA